MSLLLIERLEAGSTLTRPGAEALMEEVLAGRIATPEMVRLLTALNRRPVQVQELAGFARVMRRHATRVFVDGEVGPANMVDTCGTGGDRSGSFNISTVAAIVAAAAGARVAKHGNRAASSACGAADVLEALGVVINLAPEATARLLQEVGIAFLFAPLYHPALRHTAVPRRELGVPTVFNFIGPVANPT